MVGFTCGMPKSGTPEKSALSAMAKSISGPLGPLGFDVDQHRQTPRPHVEKVRVKVETACSSISKQDYFTTTRVVKRHVRALAREHPEGWKMQGHGSPTSTNYLGPAT